VPTLFPSTKPSLHPTIIPSTDVTTFAPSNEPSIYRTSYPTNEDTSSKNTEDPSGSENIPEQSSPSLLPTSKDVAAGSGTDDEENDYSLEITIVSVVAALIVIVFLLLTASWYYQNLKEETTEKRTANISLEEIVTQASSDATPAGTAFGGSRIPYSDG